VVSIFDSADRHRKIITDEKSRFHVLTRKATNGGRWRTRLFAGRIDIDVRWRCRTKAIEVAIGIFKEMHEGRHFESVRDYTELRRMLSEAISRGYVEQTRVIRAVIAQPPDEEWYRDKETGETYALVAPGERDWGWWTKINSEEPTLHPDDTIH